MDILAAVGAGQSLRFPADAHTHLHALGEGLQTRPPLCGPCCRVAMRLFRVQGPAALRILPGPHRTR